LKCTSQSCACSIDGHETKTLPTLCTGTAPLETSYLLWACGFPPA
jgi:hypothetical protein